MFLFLGPKLFFVHKQHAEIEQWLDLLKVILEVKVSCRIVFLKLRSHELSVKMIKSHVFISLVIFGKVF